MNRQTLILAAIAMMLVAIAAVLYMTGSFGRITGKAPETETKQPEIKIQSEDGKAVVRGVQVIPGRFPKLEPLNDSVTRCMAYSVKFDITHSYPLTPVMPENLPWYRESQVDESLIGFFLNYMIEGRNVNLGEPYIQLAYMSRGLEGNQTVNSCLDGQEQYFMGGEGSKILSPRVNTLSKGGLTFYTEEIYAGPVHTEAGTMNEKYVAMAYCEFDKDYLLGLILTAGDEFAFKDALKPFYKLVKSVR